MEVQCSSSSSYQARHFHLIYTGTKERSRGGRGVGFFAAVHMGKRERRAIREDPIIFATVYRKERKELLGKRDLMLRVCSLSFRGYAHKEVILFARHIVRPT